MAGLMLLAGLILLAACANLGSLFAARAADRSRETALRLALGLAANSSSASFSWEALLVSVAGGVCGIVGAVAILRTSSPGRANWIPLYSPPVSLP
jgi:ABC-type lipoprotein release transport system permease subunit